MEFGTRVKDAVETDGDGSYLRNFAPGDTTVRFCEELDEWIKFWQHFNEEDKRSYPCTGDRSTCPGCNSENVKEAKASLHYGTTVKLIDRDVYMPMRMKVSIYKKMKTRSERNDGTILNRDYIIIREGKGLETEYDVEADKVYNISSKELKDNLFDIAEILKNSFYEMWPELEEAEKGTQEPVAKKTRTASPVEEESQDEEITEADLKKMGIRDLRALARKHGVDSEVCELGTKPELIDAIIDIAV
jgi:hypothetical protein